jgi:hypothetical protein
MEEDMVEGSAARSLGGPVSAVLPTPVKKIRAVIFSCHNPRYYENTIEPKLERYHIETVKKIDPNKHSTQDLGDCDVVVLLLELMPSHHVSLIRQQAKQQGKELVVLHRQVSDWERAFARKEDQRVAGAVKPISAAHAPEPRLPPKVTPPPPPSRSLPPPATKEPVPMWGAVEPISSALPVVPANDEPVEAIGPEYAEWLGLVEEENVRLNAKVRELEAAAKKQATEFELLVGKNVELDKKNKELFERAKAAETTVHNHNKEIIELKALLAKSGDELEKMGKGVVTGIEEGLQHFEKLWTMGMLDAEEILKKLFSKAKK